jgi:hypothetical protein
MAYVVGWTSDVITVDLLCWYGPETSRALRAVDECTVAGNDDCTIQGEIQFESAGLEPRAIPMYTGAKYYGDDNTPIPLIDARSEVQSMAGRDGYEFLVYVNRGVITELVQILAVAN